jgi:hypothetical protein
MNAVDEVISDADLKRAQLLKISLEALAITMTCVIYAQMILDDEVTAKIKAKFQRIRNLLFGPPPMTEEQIEAEAHRLNIEARRITREAWNEF